MSRECHIFAGLDLGQARDYSALAIVEQPLWVPEDAAYRAFLDRHGWVPGTQMDAIQYQELQRHWHERPGRPPLSLPHLERFPLGTPYPEIVRLVKARLMTPPVANVERQLIVDATGVGAPVVEMFRDAGLRPLAATITAGNAVNYAPAFDAVSVPKRDLVSTVAVLLEQRRLKIAEALPEAPTLVRELQEFKRRVTPAGHEQMASWRESVHDDLVLATALACWWREWNFSRWDEVVARARGYGDAGVA